MGRSVQYWCYEGLSETTEGPQKRKTLEVRRRVISDSRPPNSTQSLQGSIGINGVPTPMLRWSRKVPGITNTQQAIPHLDPDESSQI